MAKTSPDASPLRPAMRLDALRVLLGSRRVGLALGDSLAAAAGNPELARNATVLAELAIHGSRRPAEIQKLTGLTSGGVTKLLDRMEAQGVVQRSFGQVAADRRAIVVTLTPHGIETAAALAEEIMRELPHLRETLVMVLRLVDRAAGGTEHDGPVTD